MRNLLKSRNLNNTHTPPNNHLLAHQTYRYSHVASHLASSAPSQTTEKRRREEAERIETEIRRTRNETLRNERTVMSRKRREER